MSPQRAIVAVTTRLKPAKTFDFRAQCAVVHAAAFFYNARLTLQTLEEGGVLEPVLENWLSVGPRFTKNDKVPIFPVDLKYSILGWLSILQIPFPSLPEAIKSRLPKALESTVASIDFLHNPKVQHFGVNLQGDFTLTALKQGKSSGDDDDDDEDDEEEEEAVRLPLVVALMISPPPCCPRLVYSPTTKTPMLLMMTMPLIPRMKRT